MKLRYRVLEMQFGIESLEKQLNELAADGYKLKSILDRGNGVLVMESDVQHVTVQALDAKSFVDNGDSIVKAISDAFSKQEPPQIIKDRAMPLVPEPVYTKPAEPAAPAKPVAPQFPKRDKFRR